MKYDVGQILFLLLRVEKSVIPVQIVEQVIKKSLKGETVLYSVLLPDDKETVVPLDKLSAEIFTSYDDIKNHMIESATAAISKIIEKAKELKSQRFPQDDLVSEENNDYLDQSEELEIILEDGIKGKVKLSNLDSVAPKKKRKEKR